MTNTNALIFRRLKTCVPDDGGRRCGFRSASEADVAGGRENVEKEIAEQLMVGLT